MTDAVIGIDIDPKRKTIMQARYENSESISESLSARGGGFLAFSVEGYRRHSSRWCPARYRWSVAASTPGLRRRQW